METTIPSEGMSMVGFKGTMPNVQAGYELKGKQIHFGKNGRFTVISIDSIDAVDSQKGILAGGEWFELPCDTVEDIQRLFVATVNHIFGMCAANEASKILLKEELRPPKE